MEEHVKPFVDDWLEDGTYPLHLHEKAHQAGVSPILYRAAADYLTAEERAASADYDAFHELILWDELARVGGSGVLGQLSINSMALPPIINEGADHLKQRVVREVVQGTKCISLAISEPSAGSDVANIESTATDMGDHWLVNGTKKWITGGNMADFFTVAVRTGGRGMGGLSLLLLERTMPGIHVRRMKTQFDSCHGTTFITLEDVKVPKDNIIGKAGQGFHILVRNFNHERWVIAAGTLRSARLCFEESINEALTRMTFGKPLIQHQLIRFKLAEMARLVEALQDNVEQVAYQIKCGVSDEHLGGVCALLKVNASKTFEYCSREASQIFGGSSVVREGRGKIVERLSREVRASAIPGGSEEILLDFAIRQAAAIATKNRNRQAKL